MIMKIDPTTDRNSRAAGDVSDGEQAQEELIEGSEIGHDQMLQAAQLENEKDPQYPVLTITFTPSSSLRIFHSPLL
jgi:hypothetical protein